MPEEKSVGQRAAGAARALEAPLARRRRVLMAGLLGLGLMAGGLCAARAQAAAASPAAAPDWQTLARQKGHLIIMRHALAPGVGDPPGLRLGDCSTQRNLSDEGRAQARTVGQRLREAGLGAAAVYSSQWCRTLETGRELGLGPVRELAALNSFFGQNERAPAQMRELREWIARADLSRPVVLVTHQVVMTALTGEYAQSAEALVLRRDSKAGGGVRVVARFTTPY